MMRRVAFLLTGGLLAMACERAKAPVAGASSTSGVASSQPGAAIPAMPRWDDSLGALLATPALDGGAPVAFVHDTASSKPIGVELFNHDDHTTPATLQPGTQIHSCAWRRNASLTLNGGRAAPNSWSLALTPGIATPIGVDDIGELLPRDSAALITRINHLVSAIPEDSISAPFRGLPIVVRDAWRFQLADSTPIAVAIAMRSLNVESNPRAQAITLIAEPDPSSGPGQWRTAFSERVADAEDRIEGMDLLAALQLHGTRSAVALVREGDSGLQIEIVERTAPGVWTVRWSSTALLCAQD